MRVKERCIVPEENEVVWVQDALTGAWAALENFTPEEEVEYMDGYAGEFEYRRDTEAREGVLS